MNASFNKLVEEYLPHVEIVYDRYHMQAQFGRDVLGAMKIMMFWSVKIPMDTLF